MGGFSLTSGLSFTSPYQFWGGAPSTALTGTTDQTALRIVPIPANALGANGILRVTCVWRYTNSANSKTLSVEYGASGVGVSGTPFQAVAIAAATSLAFRTQVQIHNAGATNVQNGYTVTNGGWTATTGTTPTTGAIDTTAATEIVIAGTLASSGENITLVSWFVEAFYIPN